MVYGVWCFPFGRFAPQPRPMGHFTRAPMLPWRAPRLTRPDVADRLIVLQDLRQDGLATDASEKNMTTKQKIRQLIEQQPEDATYEEIVRELAFARTVERGLADAREGRTISNEEMGRRIGLWQR